MPSDYRVDDEARLLIRRLRQQAEQRIRKQGLTGNAAIRERAKAELAIAGELQRAGEGKR